MLDASTDFSGTEKENRKVKKLRENIQKYLKVTCYESGLATRRILLGETIEASEKIFSIFEAHAEMICKGKIKAPSEFGHRVLVMQDQFGFVVKCERTEMGQVDEKIIIGHVDELKTKYPNLRSLSLDKGFWSPNNNEVLATKVDVLVMPKKGTQKRYEDQPPEYQKLKRKHSRVESCINALESGNNLHICMGRGLESFDMAVACASVARNLHVIGYHLQQKEKNKLHLKQKLSLCG
jgi:IS5 family transposase